MQNLPVKKPSRFFEQAQLYERRIEPMQTIKAKYNGEAFVPFSHISLPKDRIVYITLLDGEPPPKAQDGDRKIGILDGQASFCVNGDGKITEEEFLGL
jgi:hypothetical protein